jgi:hypothetical protein
LKKEFSDLMYNAFNGYLVVTIEGYAGIEEGVFLFKNGAIVGSLYEYTNFDIVVFGDFALQQSFNAAAADFAVFDVCELSKQQVELVIAFNEKIQLPQQIVFKDIGRFFKQKFDSAFAEKTLKQVLKKEESKYDIFKKIGLTDITTK